MTREETLIETIKFLHFIPYDLIPMIIEYEKQIRYSTQPTQIWKLPTNCLPQCIICDQQFLYFCDCRQHCLRICDLNGQTVEKHSPSFKIPSDIDLYLNCLYVIDQQKVSIFNLQFQLLSSFPIPYSFLGLNHLKVDQNLVYITIDGKHQVYVYTKEGKLKNTIGSTVPSSKQGEFNDPCGLTCDPNSLYICDYYNYRIQSLIKTNYVFRRQWGSEGTRNGQFVRPFSICYNEEVIYVGDNCSIQLFKCDGMFLQRIGYDIGNQAGQLDGAWGICVVRDKMYVTDYGNSRIQVFQRRLPNNEIINEQNLT